MLKHFAPLVESDLRPGARYSGGHALWSSLPLLLPNVAHHKERSSGLRPDIRAMVPWEISSSVARAVEAL